MAFDQSKVLATRDLKVFTVGWSSTNALPADTVLWGTAWATPSGQSQAWVEAGYTSGGLHFSSSIDRSDIRVDQELDPVLRPATGRTIRMNTNLAEFKAQNIVNAVGQGAVTTTAATTAARGHDDWAQTSTIANDYISLGFDLLHPGDNEAVRVVGWKGQVDGTPTFDFGPAALAPIPLAITLFPDTSTSPARIATIRDVIPIA